MCSTKAETVSQPIIRVQNAAEALSFVLTLLVSHTICLYESYFYMQENVLQ